MIFTSFFCAQNVISEPILEKRIIPQQWEFFVLWKKRLTIINLSVKGDILSLLTRDYWLLNCAFLFWNDVLAKNHFWFALHISCILIYVLGMYACVNRNVPFMYGHNMVSIDNMQFGGRFSKTFECIKRAAVSEAIDFNFILIYIFL